MTKTIIYSSRCRCRCRCSRFNCRTHQRTHARTQTHACTHGDCSMISRQFGTGTSMLAAGISMPATHVMAIKFTCSTVSSLRYTMFAGFNVSLWRKAHGREGQVDQKKRQKADTNTDTDADRHRQSQPMFMSRFQYVLQSSSVLVLRTKPLCDSVHLCRHHPPKVCLSRPFSLRGTLSAPSNSHLDRRGLENLVLVVHTKCF